MSVLVRIPTPLQKLVGDRAEVSVEATDLRGAVNELAAQSEDFKTRMLDDKGELRRFVNVYVNEEDVRFLQKLDTPLKDGDEVSIVPAIAGGSAVATENEVNVILPGILRSEFDGQTELKMGASTVGELIERLIERNPKFAARAFDKKGALNVRVLNIFVNEENVRFLQSLDTPLQEGDEVSIVPAIMGGLQAITTNAVSVRLPGILRADFDGEIEVKFHAATVREVVEQLGAKSPKLLKHIVDENGNLSRRSAVAIFVNEEDIRSLQKLDTQIKHGDEVVIVPMTHGG